MVLECEDMVDEQQRWRARNVNTSTEHFTPQVSLAELTKFLTGRRKKSAYSNAKLNCLGGCECRARIFRREFKGTDVIFLDFS